MNIYMRAIVIWLMTGAAVSAEPTTFTWHPPAEWRTTLRVATQVQRDDPSAPPRYAETNQTEYHCTFTQAAGKQWVTCKVMQSVSERDGQPIHDPSAEALIGRPVRFTLDATGQCIAVEVPQQPSLGQASDHIGSSDEDLTNGYRFFWNMTFGWLWGHLEDHQVGVGGSWQQPDTFWVQLGLWASEFKAAGRWRVVGRETPAPESRVRLRYQVASEPISLGQNVAQLQAWLSTKVPELAMRRWANVTATREGEVLVDPTSLLVVEWRDRKQVAFATEDSSPATLRLEVELRLQGSSAEGSR